MEASLANNDNTSLNAATTSAELVRKSISKGQLIYASIVAFLAWVFSVYDFILFGTLLPIIALEFHWSTAQSTSIATLVTLGTLLVSFTVGPITDYFGRRNALMIVTAGAALSSGLSALTFAPWYLVLVRSLSGLGYSEQAVNTTYLSEIYGAKKRGFLYSWIQGGWPVGALIAALTTSLLLPLIGWRGVFAVGTIPAIIIVLLRTKLKESPRYEIMNKVRKLIREGRVAEAEELGRKYGVDSSKTGKFTVRQLFESDTRKHTIFLSLAFVLNWFGCQIFLVLGSTVITGLGYNFSNALTVLILSNMVAYFGYVVLGSIGDRIGRRETLMIGWFCAGASALAMLLLKGSYWGVMVAYTLTNFFLNGSYSPLFTYMAESFPTRARGTGAAFVNAMGTIGALIGTALFSALLATKNSMFTSALIAGVIPILVSVLLLIGANHVPPRQELENITT